MAGAFLSHPTPIMETMGEVIDTIIGVAVFVVMIGTTIGWVINAFIGSGPGSDFDTKDPAEDLY